MAIALDLKWFKWWKTRQSWDRRDTLAS